jgi:ankyrin repeat protein
MIGDQTIVGYLLKDSLLKKMLEKRNKGGATPLLQAALHTHQNTVELLVAEGALMDTTDNTGCGILHYAAKSGNKPFFQWLLNTYPELDITNLDKSIIAFSQIQNN